MTFFDNQNDRKVGSWIWDGKHVDLFQYKKDRDYRPTHFAGTTPEGYGYTMGWVGGDHRIIYVAGPLYIRVL